MSERSNTTQEAHDLGIVRLSEWKLVTPNDGGNARHDQA